MDDDDDAGWSSGSGRPPPRMPPRAKSAYVKRAVGASPGAPSALSPPLPAGARSRARSPGRRALRRPASFTAPSMGDGSRGIAPMPPLRRNGAGSARLAPGVAGVRTPEERAFADLKNAERQRALAAGVAPRRTAGCGMCGNCTPGGMPPWAPESLARMAPEERRRALLNLREREISGRMARDIRADGRRAAAPATNDDTPVRPRRAANEGPRAVRRSSRVATINAAAAAKPSPARRARTERPDRSYRSDRIDRLDRRERQERLDRSEGSERAESSDRPEGSERSEFDDFGADDFAREPVPGRGAAKIARAASSASHDSLRDPIAAGLLNDDECSDCADLENRVHDLEMQLDVLKSVTKDRAGGDSARRESDADSLQSDDSNTSLQRNVSLMNPMRHFRQRPEKQQLQKEVEALRRATTILFSRLQESDPKIHK